MPSITLTFDNTQSLRIANAICIPQNGYNGDDSSASKIAFYKSWVINQTKKCS